jgi:hypothetical protein
MDGIVGVKDNLDLMMPVKLRLDAVHADNKDHVFTPKQQ